MTRDQVNGLAASAGFGGQQRNTLRVKLEAFARLVAAEEREACAKTVETWGAELCIKDRDMQRLYARQATWREHYAAAIRSLSQP